jgi:hypothetical protein
MPLLPLIRFHAAAHTLFAFDTPHCAFALAIIVVAPRAALLIAPLRRRWRCHALMRLPLFLLMLPMLLSAAAAAAAFAS